MSVCPYKARAKVILGNLTFHALPWVLESISSLAQVQIFPHSPHLTLLFSPGRRQRLFLLDVRDNSLHDLGLGNIPPGSLPLPLLSPGCHVREREATESLHNPGHRTVPGVSNYHHLLSGFLQQDEVSGGRSRNTSIANFTNNSDLQPSDWMMRRTILPTI